MKRICESDLAHEFDVDFCRLLGLDDAPDPLEDFDAFVNHWAEYAQSDLGKNYMKAGIETIDAEIKRLEAMRAGFLKITEKA